MSDMKASVAETKAGFHVEGYEKIEYDFTFQDQIFNPQHPQLASEFLRWKRCLAVMDLNIYNIYGKEMEAYFEHWGIELKIHKTMIGEKAKSMDTLLSIVDSMNDFGGSEDVLSDENAMLTKFQASCARSPFLWSAADLSQMLPASPVRPTAATPTTFASPPR